MSLGRPGLRQRVVSALIAVAGVPAACGAAGSSAAGPAERPPSAVRDDNAPEAVTYGRRDDVLHFGDELAERQGLDAAWVRSVLGAARYQPAVVRLVMPPPAGTAKNWAAYRARFVEPRRIQAGLEFWRANERWLRKAEEVYGVPPEIVVGIVGVETIFGQQMGTFRAVDALATLTFDFPAGRTDRSAFFRNELEQLLVLCRTDVLNPACDARTLKGSYAGALGMAQFMPSSVNRYAVDFDGDGRIDLQHSAADVIGSVAHYLAVFGWQRGLPTCFDVAVPVDTAERAALLVPDILPTFSVAAMTEHGARLAPAAQAYDGLLALVEVQNGDAAPSYVAGTTNFYAITRYNWSSYYALAVIELGEAIQRRLAAGR